MFARRALVVVPLALAWLAAPAAAEDRARPRTGFVWVDPVRDVAPDALAKQIADNHISKLLYVNRCVDGCTLSPGENDSRTNTSSIVSGTSTLSEFQGSDIVFDAIVSCLRDVYLPYDVEIVTEDPGTEVFHHEAILAGTPQEIGLPSGVGGIAPAACSPLNNVISFSFGNLDPDNVEELCWTLAQESAHSFGLPNHTFDCSDPMTYLGPAGDAGCGRKYFRNKVLPCGEFEELPCNCGVAGQNSHLELSNVFGPGGAPPATEVDIIAPSPDQQVNDGFAIFFYATNTRLVDKVELWVNGTKYLENAGYGHDKRNDDYSFTAPELPDGYLDIEIRAYDDLGTVGSRTITVLKGAPCQNADGCFEFQECNEGRCTYPPAAGQLGDECPYPQYCLEGSCVEHDGESYCSQSCNPNVSGSCPEGFTCVAEGGCFPEDAGGGCCSVAGRKDSGFPLVALGLSVLGFVALRRRRR